MNTSTAPITAGSGGPIQIQVAQHRGSAIQKALLVCGILSSIYYIALNIVIPQVYPGYSMSNQTVSELSAIGAPTRMLWVMLCTLYSVLVLAFGFGTWLAGNQNKHMETVSILLVVYGVSGFFWPPMHQREVLAAGGETFTDTMHIVFSVFTVALMMLMIGFGAAALGKRFRMYSIVTLLVLIAFGLVTGLQAPALDKGLPTPLIGVWERINIGVFMLWVIVLSVVLLKRTNEGLGGKTLDSNEFKKPGL
jgi:hypothetical protein